MSEMERLEAAVNFLKSRLGSAPEVGVILGSGLSPFADELSGKKTIETYEVPGGLAGSIQGHAGKLINGICGKKPVLVVAGRVHGYEGHSPSQVVFIPRALRKWGIRKFIITNAAGSTKKTYKPGQLVLIKDQINATSQNPLTGKELFGGDRFPDMSDLYSKVWRKKVLSAAKKLKISLKEGVYVGNNGPCFETAAEVKMFARLGGDLVGMSTVWEAIALKQMHADVLGISCVTNFGTGVSKQPLSHQEVLETTEKVRKNFNRLLSEILRLSSN